MRRFTSIAITLSMLVTLCASGFTSPSLRAQSQPNFTIHSPLINGLLPSHAGSRLTPEMFQMWENLPKPEKDEILTQFDNFVRPAILNAISAMGKKPSPDPLYQSSLYLDTINTPNPPPNQPPNVFMTASRTRGPAPLSIEFAAYATDPDEDFIESYHWNFGDGQTLTQITPLAVTHTYQTAGSYTVTLSATDGVGETGSYSAIMTVMSGINQPPQIGPTATPTSGPAPLTVSFDANASDPDGQIASYSWAFGDGQASTLAAPVHTYQEPGGYTANLVVTDNQGATTSASLIIAATGEDVVNQLPQVTITATPLSGQAPLSVSFNSNASDPDGQIVGYSWNFGDGQTSPQANPNHIYQAAGMYTASLMVTDNLGATATASIGINVMPQPPPPPPVDADGDGLPDNFETQLADAFTPDYFVSTGELFGTGLSTFQDREDAQVVMQVFPTSPPTVISYYRVLPTEIRAVINRGYLQIDYLTLWNRDDGLSVGGVCNNILGFFGLADILEELSHHLIDNERSIFVVSAPLVNGNFNTDPNAYKLERYFTAAHEGRITDRSFEVTLTPPLSAPVHPPHFLSRSKHATYPFNPEGLIFLTPVEIIIATYIALTLLCFHPSISPLRCAFFFFLADLLFFSCIVERFGNQGGITAQTRINVGALSQPINGSRFIRTADLSRKLFRRIPVP